MGKHNKGSNKMTDGQEYGKQIAEKMRELQQAFRAELNHHNDYFCEECARCETEEGAAYELAKNTDFINDYLDTEVMELIKAILTADVYGMYTAGYVPFAKSPAEYREQEKKQTGDYYHDVNKTIADFTGKLKEWSEPITD
jgi:hypothetical protein